MTTPFGIIAKALSGYRDGLDQRDERERQEALDKERREGTALARAAQLFREQGPEREAAQRREREGELASLIERARGGDESAVAEVIAARPDLADEFRAPKVAEDKAPAHLPENSLIPDGQGGWKRAGGPKAAEPKRAPPTRNTSRGVENWNEATGAWEVEKGVMPYQAPSRAQEGPTAAERAQGARTAATYKASKTTLDNLKDAIKRYRGQLEASGVEIIPGDAKSLTESAYANLTLQGKEAAKLGVLAGPDMAILEQLVNDPTTLGSAAKNVFQVGGRAKSIAKQLDQYEAIIDGYVARNEQNYNGGADPDASPAQKDWDALAARHGKEVTTKRIGPRP